MAVSSREVKNKRDASGKLTGVSGIVYDVNIKYTSDEGKSTYTKKGFLTKKDAVNHESEMKIKLQNNIYTVETLRNGKQSLKDYLEKWIEVHGNNNLRPSTIAGYQNNIKNHIVPYIGNVKLMQVSPEMLDNLFLKLLGSGLSQSSVRYVQRVLSVALEHARKYHYIETNPARDTITKFNKKGETPDPYTIEQMQQLISKTIGSEWVLPVILGGLYGLRRNEILGLRWKNVNLDSGKLTICEQLPFKIAPGTLIIDEMAPTKSHARFLPITNITRRYFKNQLELQTNQKHLISLAGQTYYDNDLVIAKPDGAPMRPDRISNNWGRLLREFDLPHIRFHDLRHTAATNMHQLTGDFFTVGEILGHTLKGVGISLGISSNLDSTTSQYVDVRIEKKLQVLDQYHNTIFAIEKKINLENNMGKKQNEPCR